MAKKIINVGQTANDRKGDSLRAAFGKVNDNFTELYTALGLNSGGLNLGAFEFTNSTMSTTDSSSITIDQATTVTSNLTVGGDLLPSVAYGGDLGSAARPWKNLYVSNNTIYIGNTAVGINQLGQLTVAGSSVSSVDRLTSSGDEVVLFGGANPYTLFPAITGGDQLQIQGAEVSTVSGNLALTSVADVNIISNGAGVGGGSHSLTFDATGLVTVPGSIQLGTDARVYGFGDLVGLLASTTSSAGLEIDGANDAILAAERHVIIRSDAGATSKNWSFNENGTLTFPDSTVQITAYPGITNNHEGSSVIVVGQVTATRGDLSVRLTNNSNTLDVELKYSNAGGQRSISVYRSYPTSLNIYSGFTTKTAGNTTWDNVGNLSVPGNSLSFIVTDRGLHKIYRVTIIADEMPGVGVAGEAYCTIEQLQ